MKKHSDPFFFCVFFLLALIIVGCEVKNSASIESVIPYLYHLSAPDTLYLNAESPYPVRVNVEDPQGLGDVVSVALSVHDTSGQILVETAMEDNGERGDIIPYDGEYFALLNPSDFSGNSGRFEIRVIATDVAGYTSDPAQDSVTVVPGVPNGSPILSDAVFPAVLNDESVNSACFEVTVFDPQGADDVDSVWCDAYLPFAVVPFYRLWLNDQGEDGDSTGEDGRFAIRMDLAQTFFSSGEYTLRFQARDCEGLKSRPLIGTVTVIRQNDPPVLSNLKAPNQISRNSTDPVWLTIQVSDPQGLGDIRQVYFNSYKPNGSAAKDNPFLMYDDGDEITSGDLVAGDGIYSRGIIITPENVLGVYRFEFFATDLRGLVSDVVRHEIEVTE